MSRLLSIKLKVKKKLTCEKCSTTRSSVDGFISHITLCEKSEEVFLFCFNLSMFYVLILIYFMNVILSILTFIFILRKWLH